MQRVEIAARPGAAAHGGEPDLKPAGCGTHEIQRRGPATRSAHNTALLLISNLKFTLLFEASGPGLN